MQRTVKIMVGSELQISPDLPSDIATELHNMFTLENPEYKDAVEHGRSAFRAAGKKENGKKKWEQIPQSLQFFHYDLDGCLYVPRGTAIQVSGLFKKYGYGIEWIDTRIKRDAVSFEWNDKDYALSSVQESAVEMVLSRHSGVLKMPAGGGKTACAMRAIYKRQQPTLWITHTGELLDQAVERACAYMNMTLDEIGIIADGKVHLGDRLTIALVQTASKDGILIEEVKDHFGFVVVDEVHHVICDMFTSVVSKLPAYYLCGLSATPSRNNGLTEVINWYMGPIVADIPRSKLRDRIIDPTIIVRPLPHVFPPYTDTNWMQLISHLTDSDDHNTIICDDVMKEAMQGHTCIVISSRKAHVDKLEVMLKMRGLRVGAVHGGKTKKTDGVAERWRVVQELRNGQYDVFVATGALIQEGFDYSNFDRLFLATPLSNDIGIEQIAGRISRTAPGKKDALLYDYVAGDAMMKYSYREGRKPAYQRLHYKVIEPEGWDDGSR